MTRRMLRRAMLFLMLLVLTAVGAMYVGMPDRPELTPRQEAMLRRETYEASTGTVAIVSAGEVDAPRVIYVHGTPGDSSNWYGYLLDPAPGWTSIALDRPGFGASGPEEHVAALADQAAAIEPLLVERVGVKPILVGHSLGAPIIAKVAAAHPDRVGGLLVIAGSMDPELEEWRWYNRVGGLLEPLMSRSLRNSNRELRPLKDELLVLRDELADIRCPVVIVHGTDDGLVPYGNVDYMLEHMTNARLRLITLDDADHFLIWNRVFDIHTAFRALVAMMSEG
ncbi:MAG: alpha/beta fold hydrolase [Planctomycetota bacterium]